MTRRGVALTFVLCACSSGPGGRPALDASTDVGTPGVDADASTTDAAASACTVRCGPAAACCATGEECVAARCLAACAGPRCGADDAQCCGAGQLCLQDACVDPGAACDADEACEAGEVCEATIGRCVPRVDDATCRFVPPPGVFDPVVQWSWPDENVLALPLVVQLTDDDGNGRVDERDVPDVVLTSFPSRDDRARLTALSGDDGRLLWRSPIEVILCGTAQPAAGDLDGDGTVEIVAIGAAGDGSCGRETLQPVVAFDSAGRVRWSTTDGIVARYSAIAIGDLEGDGRAEVLAGGAVFEHDGRLRFRRPELTGLLGPLGLDVPALADVDEDGRLELFASDAAIRYDGSTLWSNTWVPDGYPAVGDFGLGGGGRPELVVVNATQLAVLDAITGALLFGPITYEAPGAILAGPPTVADFDGDGRPEIGVAGARRYVVFDLDLPPPHERWSLPSQDTTTGSTGSTVFDFDADGRAEVVFADECHLRILRGTDGALLWSTVNTSLTALEYPVVADVDGDGNAELLVVSNDVGAVSAMRCPGRSLPFDRATRGLRVFRDRLDNWVSTRGVWNQHGYHIDNVSADGSIPTRVAPSWRTHNSWRANRLDDENAVTLAPDLVIVATESEGGACPVSLRLRARLRNDGARGVAAGVQVGFYLGAPGAGGVRIATVATASPLLPGSEQWVEAVARGLPVAAGAIVVHALADDDDAHSECREDNNAGAPLEVDCTGPG